MKVYIKGGSNSISIDIVVNYVPAEEELELAASINIEAAEIPDIDESEFFEFVQNVEGILTTRDFDIREQHASDKIYNGQPSLSYYFQFYPTDLGGNVISEKIVNMRISTHFERPFNQATYHYWQRASDRFKLVDRKHQPYDFKDVVIGSRRYKTMEEALQKIELLCDTYKKLTLYIYARKAGRGDNGVENLETESKELV